MIRHQEKREIKMFEIGDSIVVNSYTTPKVGKIVNWYYDDGNVWIVNIPGHATTECSDSELSPYKGG